MLGSRPWATVTASYSISVMSNLRFNSGSTLAERLRRMRISMQEVFQQCPQYLQNVKCSEREKDYDRAKYRGWDKGLYISVGYLSEWKQTLSVMTDCDAEKRALLHYRIAWFVCNLVSALFVSISLNQLSLYDCVRPWSMETRWQHSEDNNQITLKIL